MLAPLALSLASHSFLANVITFSLMLFAEATHDSNPYL